MTSISEVRGALVTTLRTIDGLHVYDHEPDSLDVPAAIVGFAPGLFLDYDSTQARGSDDLTLSVEVLVGRAAPSLSPARLDAFLEPSGASSVKAVVEAGLAGTVDYAVVTAAAEARPRLVADGSWYGCIFLVQVGMVPDA